MSAAELARSLGGHRVGQVWMACCPAHDDKTPSLSIREGLDGTLLVHCFAGCGQALVIAALRDRGYGLTANRITTKKAVSMCSDARCTGLTGTIRRVVVGHYAFGVRRIQVPGQSSPHTCAVAELLDTFPGELRFHPECWRPLDDAGNPVPPLPAMVALVEHAERGPVAVHATYLRPDGTGKADIPKREQKACFGPIAGGAVRLGTPRRDQWLGVAEGIETALSVAVACAIPVWAALSAAGIKNLVLPPDATHVVICDRS